MLYYEACSKVSESGPTNFQHGIVTGFTKIVLIGTRNEIHFIAD